MAHVEVSWEKCLLISWVENKNDFLVISSTYVFFAMLATTNKEMEQSVAKLPGIKLHLQEKYSSVRKKVEKLCIGEKNGQEDHQGHLNKLPRATYLYHSEKYHFNACLIPKGKTK